MRLFLLPISTRRTLIYCERVAPSLAPGATKPPIADRIINKSSEVWTGWEKAEKGWHEDGRPAAPQRLGSTSTRFGFGRRKQRASLFPLPMKIEPPQFPDTAPATPRASTGGISTGSPGSPTSSPPLTARRFPDGENGAHTPPMPSSSQVALAAHALNIGSPQRNSLYRNDSSRSACSARSSPQPPKRIGLRGRSSTMGSLGGMSDGSPTPPNGFSGRTSTSTAAGRSSFSNLFGLGRFRQNDLHPSRHGSPAHYGGTPSSSHQNSFSISRDALPERISSCRR